MGRGFDWAMEDVAQLRDWLHESRRPREMHAQRLDWSLESITSKLKQLRHVASDQSRPVQRRRTCEAVAEIGTALNEHRQSSLGMSRSTLSRAFHDDLQARCFKPVRAPRLSAINTECHIRTLEDACFATLQGAPWLGHIEPRPSLSCASLRARVIFRL